MTYSYQPYPRRLYMAGQVIEGDLHAKNSVVVHSEAEEADARANGYRKAYEPEPIGGNGDSSPSSSLPGDQGAVADASADQTDEADESPDDGTDKADIEALRAEAAALGLKVHHRAGAEKLRAAIAAAKSIEPT